MDAVESVLDRCEHYSNYFRMIQPILPHDIWRRYMFAYTTVNLSWQSSVRLYTELNKLQWPAAEADIRAAFITAKSGFYDTRPRMMADCASIFFSEFQYTRFQRKPDQDWLELRSDLDKLILGLGQIKISFTMELCYPEETEIVCLDRHMLGQVFHTDPTRTTGTQQYLHCERQWVETCRRYGAAPGIARLAYWDKLQGRNSPDYWAHVFKTERI
jgi:thermostable 8-oxoguanine DNA glycosylase